MADGSKLSTSTAGMSYRDISGCLGAALRSVQTGRTSYLSSLKRFLEALPPPPNDMLEGVVRGTGRGDQSMSITHAMSVMLGFVPAPISPAKMTIGLAASKPHQHSDVDKKISKPCFGQDCKPITVGSTSGNQDPQQCPSEGADRESEIATVISSSSFEDQKQVPSELVATGNPHDGCKAIPMEVESSASSSQAKQTARKASMKNEISSTDSDAEESIPDAIGFKANDANKKGSKPCPGQEYKPIIVGTTSGNLDQQGCQSEGSDQKPEQAHAISSSASNVEDRKHSPSVLVITSDPCDGGKAIPMEVESSSSDNGKHKIKKGPRMYAISSTDSDSEESIPDAIKFKSCK